MEQDVKKKVDEFFAKYPYRTYPKKKILIFCNEKSSHVHYLISGNVKQYGVSKQGNEVIVNIFKPPAFFPMSHVVSDATNQYIYETINDVEAKLAPASDVLDFIKGNPDVMFDLIKRLYVGLDGVIGRTMHLMSSSARNRLVYELILECERFVEKSEISGCKILLSERELGERTGLSRETINRELSRLKKEGYLRVERREIRIPDIDILKNILKNS